MPTSVELREQRAALVAQARTLTDKAATENRDLNNEEQEQFDKHMANVDKYKSRIDQMEKLESAEADLDEVEPRTAPPLAGKAKGHDGATELRSGFTQWMKSGVIAPELRSRAGIPVELRDQVLSTDGKGGFLVPPVQVTADLVKQIDDLVFMRKLSTVRQVTEAKALGIRKLKTRQSDADWTAEVGSVTEDTATEFDRRDLTPNLLSKLVKLSIKLLLVSSDAEKLMRDELAYKKAITQEKAFLTGNGVGKPLGVFTASANGISTGRDMVCGTATALSADGLIDAKFSLKAGYLQSPKASWIFHRDAVKQIRKLKDNQNQYLWQAGLQAGAPDRILDLPYAMSEYAPNTFTAGLYVGIIGDFQFYWIVELVDMLVQRLVEKYADTNEVGFIGRTWVDGAPLLEEAFTRLKLAAA